jgi:hypothetical protein
LNDSVMKGYAYLPYPIKNDWCLQIIHEDFDTFNV